jgi:DsbC/DsbD-like thiol-disulfide interchange protein
MKLSRLYRKIRGLGVLLLFLTSVSQAWALTPFEEFNGTKLQASQVKVKSTISPPITKAGGKFKLHVQVSVDQGWHIYSINPREENKMLATTLHLRSNRFLPVGEWKESEPTIRVDEVLQKALKTHESMVDFVHEFQVPDSMIQGAFFLKGEVIYRVCDNHVCSLPKKMPFTSKVQILR